MTEIWYDIAGYGGRYSVSNQGRVWSNVSGRELKPTPWSPDYPSVKLCRDGDVRRVKVAALVLEAFIGPRPLGLFACHKDDNRQNSRLDNLCWGTRVDNGQDALRNGRHHHARKTHCARGHEFTPENTYHTRRGSRNCRACGAENAREYRAEYA